MSTSFAQIRRAQWTHQPTHLPGLGTVVSGGGVLPAIYQQQQSSHEPSTAAVHHHNNTTASNQQQQLQTDGSIEAEWYRSCHPDDSERRWAMFSNNVSPATTVSGATAGLAISTGNSSSVGGATSPPSAGRSPQKGPVQTPPHVLNMSQQDDELEPLSFAFDSEEDDDVPSGSKGVDGWQRSGMDSITPTAPPAIGDIPVVDSAPHDTPPHRAMGGLNAQRTQQELFLEKLGTGGITMPPPPPSAAGQPFSTTTPQGGSGPSSRRANRQASSGRTLEALMNSLQFTDLLTPTYRDKEHTQSEAGVVVVVDETDAPAVLPTSAVASHSPSYKKKLCREFFGKGNGSCRHGEKCLFLHEKPPAPECA